MSNGINSHLRDPDEDGFTHQSPDIYVSQQILDQGRDDTRIFNDIDKFMGSELRLPDNAKLLDLTIRLAVKHVYAEAAGLPRLLQRCLTYNAKLLKAAQIQQGDQQLRR